MNIFIEIGHPGQVHHFKNLIKNLELNHHNVYICAIDKEVTLELLNRYDFSYETMGKNKGKGFINKIPLLFQSYIKMITLSYRLKPDLFICRGSPISAHVSQLLNKPCISFNDTEHTKLLDSIVFPFLSVILTPSCFQKNIGEKQIRYNGYHQLAYLHPIYFNPDPGVLKDVGVEENDNFIILRFVSWGAHHDIGHSGIKNKFEFVKKLEKYGRVIITSESPLEPELEQYKLKVAPEKLHDLLYYATLYIGEGGTTASEAAVLGTPAIFISSLSGTMGNFTELEDKYGLLFSFKEEDVALSKAIELLQKPNLKEEWKEKRDVLLKDKIDVTEFMVNFIENYSNENKMG
jgi:predicted glycosyltransferase